MSCNNGCEYHKTTGSKCKSNHPKPKKALLECGEGTGFRTFTSSDDVSFQLAHVTLNTTCLNRPEILIKFSSIVDIARLSGTGSVRLEYELFKVCGDSQPSLLGTWMYEEVNFRAAALDRQEESFSFIYCECENCPRCCEYFVVVTPIEVINATVTVSNGRIAALSGDICDDLRYEDKILDQKYEDKSKLKHPKPKEMLLVCGSGNGSVILRAAEPTVNIAHVTVDTSCLGRPEVLIEFSSMINIDSDVVAVCLQFELFRICDDGEPLSLGTWNFKRAKDEVSNDNLELIKAFDFIFCECNAKSSCCEYFVRVTPLEIEIEQGSRANVVVDNTRIVALAKSEGDLDSGKTFDRKDECLDCVSKHPTAKKILLECGMGSGRETFTSSDEPAFQLAQVDIDTTCLCKPVVNIEFSSIVSFEVLVDNNVDGILLYELFRVCDNRKAISVGTWVLERIDMEIIEKSTNTFNFTFCDCVTCPGCCNYFVTVTPVLITPEGITATVSDGRIAALAQEG